jgi:Cytochrome C biogenesis protein transmembrane region
MVAASTAAADQLAQSLGPGRRPCRGRPSEDVSMSPDVASGSLVVAAGISLAAGTVSVASPCVLPLVPGYLGFVSGLSGADMAEGGARARGAVVAGAGLFVLGFAVFFTLIGGAFGALGAGLVASGSWSAGSAASLSPRSACSCSGCGGRGSWSGNGALSGRSGGWAAGRLPPRGGLRRRVDSVHRPHAGRDPDPHRRWPGRLARSRCGARLRLRGRPWPAVPGCRGGSAAWPWRGAVCPPTQRPGGAGRRGMLLVVGVLLVTGWWDRFIVQLQPLIGGFRTPL